jgi:hypothetical protein
VYGACGCEDEYVGVYVGILITITTRIIMLTIETLNIVKIVGDAPP